MKSINGASNVAHHLTQVLGRIESVTQQARTYCCTTCGCLCRRGESCPACALNLQEIA